MELTLRKERVQHTVAQTHMHACQSWSMNTIYMYCNSYDLTATRQSYGESVATTKGHMDFICLQEHWRVRAWEPTMASRYCSNLGFLYAFFWHVFCGSSIRVHSCKLTCECVRLHTHLQTTYICSYVCGGWVRAVPVWCMYVTGMIWIWYGYDTGTIIIRILRMIQFNVRNSTLVIYCESNFMYAGVLIYLRKSNLA